MWFLGNNSSLQLHTFVLACIDFRLAWNTATCSSYSLRLSLQVILGRGVLIHVAALLDNLFYGHPTALLYFVMVMCPLCMNLVQVCRADLHLDGCLVKCNHACILGIRCV